MSAENKVLCILPWIHTQIRQNGEVYPCCRVVNSYSYGSTHESTLKDIWNSEKIKKVRREMLQGIKQSFCEDCYIVENLGGTSLRQMRNDNFKDEFYRLDKTSADGELLEDEIIYLDLRFSNVCNFKCRTCSPDSSNSWYEDHQVLHGKYINPPKKTRKVAAESKTILADIDRLLPKLKKIYFAGGEPLLDANHYLLLEKLISLGRTDVELHYNSNLSYLEYSRWNAISLWQKFSHIRFSASIDAIGKPLELIRKGSNWENTKKNLSMIRTLLPHVAIQIYPTVGVMNCFLLPELIDHFFKESYFNVPFNFEINIMNDPDYLSVAILNESEIKELENKYELFLKTIQDKAPANIFELLKSELARVIRYARLYDFAEKRDKFRKFTFTLDQARNEKTINVIPELLQVLYER